MLTGLGLLCMSLSPELAKFAVAVATSSSIVLLLIKIQLVCVCLPELCVCVDMGAGLYGASKFIATSDLITTVTPEKRTEEGQEKPGTETTNQRRAESDHVTKTMK